MGDARTLVLLAKPHNPNTAFGCSGRGRIRSSVLRSKLKLRALTSGKRIINRHAHGFVDIPSALHIVPLMRQISLFRLFASSMGEDSNHEPCRRSEISSRACSIGGGSAPRAIAAEFEK